MNHLSLLCVEDKRKLWKEGTLNLNSEEEKWSVLYERSTKVYLQNDFMQKTSQKKLDLWSSSINLKQHERKQCELSTTIIIICGKRQMDAIMFHMQQPILGKGPCESYAKSNTSKDHCLEPEKFGNRESIKLLNMPIKQEIYMQLDYLNLCTNYKQCLHA